MTTRLAWDRYLEHVEADSAVIAEILEQQPDVDVPTCPGWTVRDLAEHVAVVYEHKIVCVRTLSAPEEWPPPVPDVPVVTRLRAAAAELVGLLRERGPEAQAATWWPEDQTTGFWYRRMAHEAAVHRADAELAVGRAAVVDDELAVDGIDEVLTIFFGGDWGDVPAEEWGDVQPQAGADRPVAVVTGDRVWRVVMHPDRVEVDEVSGEVVASIGGGPSEVLLWLWRRAGDDAVEVSGDPEAVTALYDRLALATQ